VVFGATTGVESTTGSATTCSGTTGSVTATEVPVFTVSVPVSNIADISFCRSLSHSSVSARSQLIVPVQGAKVSQVISQLCVVSPVSSPSKKSDSNDKSSPVKRVQVSSSTLHVS
jgi:hypothetical protein